MKIPRWAFEKFPEADRTLTTQMKSVGEVMAIGRTFKEALQKAVRSLEQDRWGLDARPARRRTSTSPARADPRVPTPTGCFAIARGLSGAGSATRGDRTTLTRIDPWFLDNMREIVEFEAEITAAGSPTSARRCAGPSSSASPTGASPTLTGAHRG